MSGEEGSARAGGGPGATPASPVAFDSSEPALEVLRQLTALSRAIAKAESLDRILDLAARQAAGILGADRAVLMLVGDDGRAHSRAVHGVDPAVGDGLVGVLNERLIHRLEEVLVGGAARAFMAVPLIVQGDVTGLLAVTREGETRWSRLDEAVLAAVADQSAAPIEIARLSEEVRQARLVAENARLHDAARAARAELDAERDRLATVLEHIPVGVVLTEAHSGRVTFVNRATVQMLRLADDAPKDAAMSVLQACARADGQPYPAGEAALVRALGQGETLIGEELECVRSDGTAATFSVNATAIRDARDEIVAAVTTFSDVTQRRRIERHLRQVQQMDAVGRLAGGVAHEANNQMLVVLSAADFVLRRTDVPEDVRRDVQQIERAAQRTAAVTAQLLAFSRRQIMRPEVLELDPVVADLAPVLGRTLGEACTLDLRLASGGVRVRVDRGQLEQVLLNLAINARDAMPDGGVVTLETRPVELGAEVAGAPPGFAVRPGAYLLLTFRDTGQGMEPDTLGHLFEPFFTTKPVGKGTGLGLATVYGIVKQSDGYVWAASEPGDGAAFMVYLPIVAEVVTPTAAGSPAAGAVPGEVILVVEDEPSVLVMTARVLRDGGYRVLEAANGQIALELLDQYRGRLDLVVTDVAMPALSGLELAARLRGPQPGLPVVFISGYLEDEAVHRELRGADAFLLKPFAPDAIIACVRSLLDRASGR